ncbi:hypothetical protein [Aureimonas glaciei]|uniref:hypothetical protein n=1 Tax=Aureimonas glaciei TaxID=1776957 RepID=UPI001666562B|nr:hypothetical protein [Aureimonas glaciei]
MILLLKSGEQEMVTRLVATVELSDESGQLHYASKFERPISPNPKSSDRSGAEAFTWQMRDGRVLNTKDEWTFQGLDGSTYDLMR